MAPHSPPHTHPPQASGEQRVQLMSLLACLQHSAASKPVVRLLDGPKICQLLATCGQLKCPVPPILLALLLAELVRDSAKKLPVHNGDLYGETVRGLALIERHAAMRTPQSAHPVIWAELLRGTQRMLQQRGVLKPDDLARLVWGFAAAGQQDPALFEAVEAELLRQGMPRDPQLLGHLAYAYAIAGYPAPGLCRALCSRVKQLLPSAVGARLPSGPGGFGSRSKSGPSGSGSGSGPSAPVDVAGPSGRLQGMASHCGVGMEDEGVEEAMVGGQHRAGPGKGAGPQVHSPAGGVSHSNLSSSDPGGLKGSRSRSNPRGSGSSSRGSPDDSSSSSPGSPNGSSSSSSPRGSSSSSRGSPNGSSSSSRGSPNGSSSSSPSRPDGSSSSSSSNGSSLAHVAPGGSSSSSSSLAHIYLGPAYNNGSGGEGSGARGAADENGELQLHLVDFACLLQYPDEGVGAGTVWAGSSLPGSTLRHHPQQPSSIGSYTTEKSSSQGSGSSNGSSSVGGLAAAAQQYQQDQALGGAAVARLLWSLARLRHKDPELLDQVAEYLIRSNERQNLSGWEIAHVAWAYAELRYPYPRLFTTLARQFSREHSYGINNTSLCMLLRAYAEVGHYSRPLFSLLFRQAMARLKKLRPGNMVDLMWTMAKSGHHHEALAEEAWTGLQGQLHSLHSSQLADLAWAVENLGMTAVSKTLVERTRLGVRDMPTLLGFNFSPLILHSPLSPSGSSPGSSLSPSPRRP